MQDNIQDLEKLSIKEIKSQINVLNRANQELNENIDMAENERQKASLSKAITENENVLELLLDELKKRESIRDQKRNYDRNEQYKQSSLYQDKLNIENKESSSVVFKNVTIQIQSEEKIDKYSTLLLPSDDNGTLLLGEHYTYRNYIDRLINNQNINTTKSEVLELLKRGYYWYDSKEKNSNPVLGIYVVKPQSKETKSDLTGNFENALDARLKELSNASIFIPLFMNEIGITYLNSLTSIIKGISNVSQKFLQLKERVLFNLHIPNQLEENEKLTLVQNFENLLNNEISFNDIEKDMYDSIQIDIKKRILASRTNNFWWLNAVEERWNIEELEKGENVEYRAKGDKGRYKQYVKRIKQGELFIGYQGKPSYCIMGILELVEEVKNSNVIILKLIYLFDKKTTYSELKEQPLFKESGLARNLQGSFKPLTYDSFEEIINTTELYPLEDIKNEDVPTHRDSPAIIDKLNRKPLADSLCSEIRDLWKLDDTDSLESDKLYTVHVQGPWGAGKSTFLNLIEQNLCENIPNGEDPWVVIKYNAWKNQHIDPPWWTLIETIYNQATEKVSKKAGFILREWYRRLIAGNMYYLILTGIILLITILISFLAIPSLFPTNDTQKTIEIVTGGDVENTIKRTVITENDRKALLEKFSIAIALISGILLSVKTLHTSIKSTLIIGDISAVKSFKVLSKDPQGKIKKHYADIIKSINKPVAVFVDDLDRCHPKYTVDFLEGLLTLFKEPKVLYIIAADKKWIANCFEIQYEKFAKNYDQKGTTLGYHFIQKAFQLSVKLPEIGSPAIKKYWQYILNVEKKEPRKIEEKKIEAEKKFKSLKTEKQIYDEIDKSRDDEGSLDPVVLSAAVSKFSDPEITAQEEEHILTGFFTYLEPNPRSIKRMANYYNLFRNSLVLEGKIIERTYIIRWLVLSQRWPLIAEALDKDSSIIEMKLDTIKDENLKSLLSNKSVEFVIEGTKEEYKPLTKDIIDQLIGI